MTQYASLKVLVVDDSPTMLMITQRVLRQLGFQIIGECKDGATALSRIAQEPYDLILLDWGLPDITGTDVLAAIRADRRCDTTKVLMITAESRQQIVEAILAMGGNGYVVKPYTAETLTNHINRLFPLNAHDTATPAPAASGC